MTPSTHYSPHGAPSIFVPLLWPISAKNSVLRGFGAARSGDPACNSGRKGLARALLNSLTIVRQRLEIICKWDAFFLGDGELVQSDNSNGRRVASPVPKCEVLCVPGTRLTKDLPFWRKQTTRRSLSLISSPYLSHPITITTAPAVISNPPATAAAFIFSPSSSHANTITSGTLNLSSGATREAGPSCSARK